MYFDNRHVREYTYTYVYICIYMCVWVCVYILRHVSYSHRAWDRNNSQHRWCEYIHFIHIFIRLHIYIKVYVYINIYKYKHIYIDIHIHIRTYIYIDRYIYINKHICKCYIHAEHGVELISNVYDMIFHIFMYVCMYTYIRMNT